MYMERMLSVGKAENGYIIECEVPMKPEKKGSDKMISCCNPHCSKQYIAKDEKEVAALIADMMPLLDMEHDNEESFDKAFNKAVGMQEMEGAKAKKMEGMK